MIALSVLDQSPIADGSSAEEGAGSTHSFVLISWHNHHKETMIDAA
jgi:hypothetical protein